MTQRPIKFRVWNTVLKEMLPFVGELSFVDGKLRSLKAGKTNDWVKDGRTNVEREDLDKVVLMQFTGLHDKNGKEIWEGDVVRYPSGEVASVYWSEVREGVMPCYALEPVYRESFDDSFAPALDHDTYHRLEVIGNIYENPEFIQSLKK